ncbi:MAG: hypothetical protein V4501_10965 [Pseudomonadota bacterium]
MDNLYSQLEAQVKALVQQCETLKQEKQSLLIKHNSAITALEEMVSLLKSREPR